MKSCIVKTLDSPDWNSAEKAYIKSYTWGCSYRPKAFGQIIHIKNKGFALKMTAYEATPKALYNDYNDPVYKDSCLEFFVSFNNNSPLYMNFEINSNGAFLSAIRRERKDKTPIDSIADISKIPVKTEKNDECWSVEIFFSYEIIKSIFGEFEIQNTFKGNFYKCGDETAEPHFGSWSPIDLPTPDFHCPQFFGEFIVE